MAHEYATDVPSPGGMGDDNGSSWVQITEEARIRASIPPDLGSPVWEGSWLRRRLWLRRAAVVVVIAAISALLGWAVIAGIKHAFASYTRTDGIVTAQTETGRHSDGCQLDLDYTVGGQQLQGVTRVNAVCNTLPGPGSRAALNVDTTDPHDIWIDGASDANHPNPLLFGLFFLFVPAAVAFALWTELTDYGGIRKLLASGAQWRQFEATVTRKTGSRSGITVRLEAEDVSGNLCPFNVFYKFISPIGSVRKGDKVTLTLIANGKWQALIWRPDLKQIYLAHISRSL